MTPRFLDTSVLVYAFGAPSRWREPSREILGRAEAGEVELHVSVEALQEFLFHRMRRTDRTSALREADALCAATVAHPFDDAVWERSLGLVGSTSIRGRDAVHAATALIQGFTEIVTTDADFVAVPGLTPVRPDAIGD